VRRSLTIVVSVAFAILVAVGGALGLRAAREQIAADRIGASAPQGAPSGDEAKYHELAERLLTFGFGPNGGTPSVTLLPAALPTDPSLTLPNVNGARLIGSAIRTQATDRYADIVLDAPGDTQRVATAYEQGFKDQGWTAPPGDVGLSPGGGFQPSAPSVYKLLCKGDSAFLSLSVTARSGQPSDVRIHLQPTGGQGGTPCTASKSRQQGPGNHLPTLRPPDGTSLLGGGGGSSSAIGSPIGGPGGATSRQSSEATAVTLLSAGALEAAFAKQLVAAGWTRTAGRDDGALAWSSWASGEAGWSGTLIVTDTIAKDRRSLLLRAEGPAN
jgi:hypothetical protein